MQPTPFSIEQSAKAAREASRRLATLTSEQKNAALADLSGTLEQPDTVQALLRANALDMRESAARGLPAPKLMRLELTEDSVRSLARSLRAVAALPDPIGAVTRDDRLVNGLRVRKVRTPLGVVAMVYEARPGVTIEAFALCFKAGNACILKGGKESAHSNAALSEIIRQVLAERDLPAEAMHSVSTMNRDELKELLGLNQYIDLVIPRGGRELIEFVVGHSTIPTIQHFQGVCHIFVDESADLEMAVNVCATAKTSAPAACNAAECILIHKNIADRFVPALVQRYARDGVEVRGTPLVQALAGSGETGAGHVRLAQSEDFGHEFLDLVVAMRIVENVDEAIDHIATYGSNHTEAILTCDGASAEMFTAGVQSSCVLVNASTRFNDGFSLGLGAEIGISTSRIHAYGPMGLEELTTQRWVVEGNGHCR
ncbi:MAG: glutamate-5-semialdehyde dehydrogenase [Phycisphaerales bacterium]|nr:glutamate-5-semialdehyde dehydrogenase [Phycisphaerales bacterium]